MRNKHYTVNWAIEIFSNYYKELITQLQIIFGYWNVTVSHMRYMDNLRYDTLDFKTEITHANEAMSLSLIHYNI